MSFNAGWSGSWQLFLLESKASFITKLERFYQTLPWTDLLDPSQKYAWESEYTAMQATLQEVLGSTNTDPNMCWIAFEQELVGEGGKRAADVNLVLPSGHLFVVEFKHKQQPSEEEILRARFDLETMLKFHSESTKLKGHCYLALTHSKSFDFTHQSVICDRLQNAVLPKLVNALTLVLNEPYCFDALKWQNGIFERQPTILHGTVKVFFDNDIPNLKTESGRNIVEVRNKLKLLHEYAKSNRKRYIVVVNGRPGAGKTLLGISAVADAVNQFGASNCRPVFLSGNGPLVNVLRYTLDFYGKQKKISSQIDGRSLIQHLLDFKKDIRRQNHREESFVVFDEAQRAWDGTSNGNGSEMDLFCNWLANKEYGVLVLLIGDGQAIHKNEMSLDGMMASLDKALLPHRHLITPIVSSTHAQLLPSVKPIIQNELYLEAPIRQNYTELLDGWINAVLNSDASQAATLAKDIQQVYPLRITQHKASADKFANDMQASLHIGNKSTDAFRVGWVKSSMGGNMDLAEVKDTSAVTSAIGKWYVDKPSSPYSCCQLSTAVTEFSCQGLELSIVLFEWGNDLLYQDSQLQLASKPVNRRSIDDYTYGSYRVLLSRGRSGLVIKCNDNATYQYLLECGMLGFS